MNITTVGVDLAKNVITVCTLDQHGQVIETKDLRASEFTEWLVHIPAGTQCQSLSSRLTGGVAAKRFTWRITHTARSRPTTNATT